MGVADIGEVVGLGAGIDGGVLHLDEVADMRALADRRPRPEPRERPDDRARRDRRAFDVGEALDRDAVARLLTPVPKKTLGSTVTSRPSFVSYEKNTVSGAISVAPADHRRRAALSRWNSASAAASSARSLTPITSSASASSTATVFFARLASCDEVGQVILALGIRVADLAEHRQQRPAERHDPGIAEPHRPLRRVASFTSRIAMSCLPSTRSRP